MRSLFEEKTYENYFNSELARCTDIYFPLRQVQEGSLGFDSSAFSKNWRLWRRVGHPYFFFVLYKGTQPETFKIFADELDITKLATNELAFLWCSSKLRVSEIEQWCEDNEPFSLDFVFPELARLSNTDNPILTLYNDLDNIVINSGVSNWDLIYRKYVSAILVLNSSNIPILALYSFVCDSEGEGLEIIIESTGDFVA